VTSQSFDEAHLRNPALRALLKKVTVVVNDEFNKMYKRTPVEHHSRVTVVLADGRTLTGETGGDSDDLSFEKTDAQIEEKFRGLTGGFLDSTRANGVLDLLWHLDEIEDVSVIPETVIAA
jgi:2-methylcitrate dehydratase PrpD